MIRVLAQASDVLPDDNTGYVAAAYLVFFVLALVYFAIMAAKLQRIERELVELNQLADERADGPVADTIVEAPVVERTVAEQAP